MEGLFLFLPMIVALIYGEDTWTVYLVCAALTLRGGARLFPGKESGNFRLFAREGYVAVALGWVLMSLIGAVAPVGRGGYPPFCGRPV